MKSSQVAFIYRPSRQTRRWMATKVLESQLFERFPQDRRLRRFLSRLYRGHVQTSSD